jgi:16S rRNA (guanine1207-N2)-methyltransferase
MSQSNRLHLPFEEGAIPSGQPALFVRPSGPDGLEVFDKEQSRFIQGFFPAHRVLTGAGWSEASETDCPFSLATVFVTRSRTETLGNIARAAARLSPNGVILVDGSKTDGIDAILKHVRKRVAEVESRAKAHGKVFWFNNPGDKFDEWLTDAEPSRNSDGFWTMPGIFSAEGIDRGSAVLADFLPANAKGRAADLGAGWGFLSDSLLEKAAGIERLDLFEAERAALEMAERNVTDSRARFVWADVTRVATNEGPYDLIVSNPPFHVERTPDPSIGRAFIRAASRLLAPKGTFLMVANRQLPYEAEFDACFLEWSQMAVAGGFKILRATRPRKT